VQYRTFKSRENSEKPLYIFTQYSTCDCQVNVYSQPLKILQNGLEVMGLDTFPLQWQNWYCLWKSVITTSILSSNLY